MILGILLLAVPYILPSDDILVKYRFVTTVFGGVLFLLGFNQIKLEYDYESELRALDFAKKKSEYLEYFRNKGYLSVTSEKEYTRDIKGQVR
ncbi:MAG TPA: hypothetical protein VJH22_03245 [Candidatus Nanoarchaeia archaeon]|nr:hypothetical protein [Candidatus Nanoarchaeia archaeon]